MCVESRGPQWHPFPPLSVPPSHMVCASLLALCNPFERCRLLRGPLPFSKHALGGPTSCALGQHRRPNLRPALHRLCRSFLEDVDLRSARLCIKSGGACSAQELTPASCGASVTHCEVSRGWAEQHCVVESSRREPLSSPER